MKKLFLVLLAIFILRLPSLFEPNWYGDEGIYLVLGQVIHKGGILYRDIWDNKTPLLYFIYAILPVLWFAKIMATVFVLITCVGIYKITKSWLATLVAGILLSLPYFEGTIANAELFIVLPIVWGAYLVTKVKGIGKDRNILLGIGTLAGIAFLIKVPAIFDFLGMFVFLGVFLFEMLWNKNKPKVFIKALWETFFPIGIGFLIPVALIGFYFLINQTFGDFVTAAFSQNASYVATDSGPFSNLSNPLFTKGLALVLTSAGMILLFLKKKISKELLLFALWFIFSLYGSLLSNRHYMHYLIQVIPAAVILVTYLIKNRKSYFWYLAITLIFIGYVVWNFNTAFHLHGIPYYKNFYNFISERKTWTEYTNFFDPNTIQTYKLAEIVRDNASRDDKIFVWDDRANVYVLSERTPATKFIQAHHLTTVSPTNYQLIIDSLKENPPKLILISQKSHFKFPELENFASKFYEIIGTVDGVVILKVT